MSANQYVFKYTVCSSVQYMAGLYLDVGLADVGTKRHERLNCLEK